MRGDSLTIRQQKFVEEYLVDMNGTQAAIRAGYSEKTAQAISAENLSKPIIKAALDAARQKMAERTNITQDEVLRQFARIGFADMRSMFTESGALKPLSDLTLEEAASISSIEVVTNQLPAIKGGPAEVEYVHKIRFWDKVGALTQIGRHLGMFLDKTAQIGPDGKPLDNRGLVTLVVQK